MKRKTCFMVQCIAPKDSDLIDLLSSTVKDFTCKRWKKVEVLLEKNIDYWKQPGYVQLIYSFNTTEECLLVKDFIKECKLGWSYTNHADDVVHYDEDSVWSKLNNPHEFFLIPEVEWVHVYTWDA